MRDLVRARSAAVQAQRVHRQQVSAFMLKHGRVYPRKKSWSMRYLRWLQEQRFEHPAHQIAWQAQSRLTGRYRTLSANGKKTTVVCTVVARELAGFMWAVAREVQTA